MATDPDQQIGQPTTSEITNPTQHYKASDTSGGENQLTKNHHKIFMKYGRQRWKLKGRIEANGKQVWDGEEMVFQPLVTEFLSIKVTELKSLANHVIVGNVSCETKDLFAALPQSVAVDINDLGTIKLSLEVVWNPFDKDDQTSAASTVNKVPTVNKRFSTYNQSPPDTPSLREQAFYNALTIFVKKKISITLDTETPGHEHLKAIVMRFRNLFSQLCQIPRIKVVMVQSRIELEHSHIPQDIR
ncbi:rho family-interacting cell polarization regulator 1-like [Rhincodon typus]|uniref:rho family-interacting cell polarization regulator 1-like n=1 Tax=Rhincodon typus TaxID=259920 RepID=UPI00202F8CD9|nr:rho family-interacting cell polarization regulator 1-like [Rhincodon typus]